MMTTRTTESEPVLRPPDLEPPPIEPEKRGDDSGIDTPVYHLRDPADPERALCGVALAEGGKGYRGFSDHPCGCCIEQRMREA